MYAIQCSWEIVLTSISYFMHFAFPVNWWRTRRFEQPLANLKDWNGQIESNHLSGKPTAGILYDTCITFFLVHTIVVVKFLKECNKSAVAYSNVFLFCFFNWAELLDELPQNAETITIYNDKSNVLLKVLKMVATCPI